MNNVENYILNTLSGFTFIIGIIEVFLDIRMLKLVLGVTGFIIGGLLCARMVFDAIGNHPVIAIIAGLVGGTIGSSLMIVFFVFGLFILGAALGYLLGGAITASYFGFGLSGYCYSACDCWRFCNDKQTQEYDHYFNLFYRCVFNRIFRR